MTELDLEKQRLAAIRTCWFLSGATASGKTTIGLELADRLGAEIISLDSMAIYRHMDIGTAKPTRQQQAAVPHHLIDVVGPDETFSVADYSAAAWAKINEIQASGKQVLFVGGTPLYLKALLRGMFDGPPADWAIRREIEAEIETHGLPALRQRLEMIDPLTAHKLHPNDKRRMIRAIEVYRKTGQPISHLQREFEEDAQAESHPRVVVLSWPRAELHRRIEFRVASMFSQGLVDEVKALLGDFPELSRTASQAVGYREVISHLQTGSSVEETQQAVLVRTRQFARRQETWYRGLKECRWFELNEASAPAENAQAIFDLVEENANCD